MVFQDYALYPHMSVRQNLSFGLQQRDLPKQEIEARITEAAGLLGLAEFLDRKPAQLSGGQRQRVAIGRALVKRPKIFLFDEPLSNLDAQLRSRTRVEIADLHRRFKSTSIYVTHDQVEAMTLADRIVLMERGRIRQVGSPEQVYERPANRFVAGFIGTPGMNFLEGDVVEINGGAIGFRFQGMGERSTQTLRFAAGEAPRAFGRAVIGLRAEKIAMTESSRGDVVARVSLLEPHGHETHVLAEVAPGVTWTLRVAGPVSVHSGDMIGLRFKQNDVHWFAADEEGERIDFDFLPASGSTLRREPSPPSVTYH
jgi:ABC-type sugar transport system ATPase subunit